MSHWCWFLVSRLVRTACWQERDRELVKVVVLSSLRELSDLHIHQSLDLNQNFDVCLVGWLVGLFVSVCLSVCLSVYLLRS